MRIGQVIRQYSFGFLIFVLLFVISSMAAQYISQDLLDAGCEKKLYLIESRSTSSTVSSCSTGFSFIDNKLLATVILLVILLSFTYLFYKATRSIWLGKFSWIIFALISLVVLGYVVIPLMIWDYSDDISKLVAAGVTAYLILVALGRFANSRYRLQSLEKTYEYANGTVGIKSDKPLFRDLLNFEATADNVRSSLLTINDPVTVVAITGKLGSGKSTFWRIVAEKLNKEKNLHTYMSLTQSNSTHDFSKLFAEKWFETLSNRYPMLINISYFEQRRLFNVLRDTTDGLLKFIFSALPMLSGGLFKTRTKAGIWERSSELINDDFVDKGLARMFYYIPHINEDRWFIVIDEIERAPFEEIYRLIEIIERFKYVAKKGSPTRLIFILCVDDSQALETLDRHKDISEKTTLIRSFINADSKLVDRVVDVPTADINTKLNFIESHLLTICKEETSDEKSELLRDIYDFDNKKFENIEPVYIPIKGLTDRKDRYSYIMEKLASATPRTVVRVARRIDFRRKNQQWTNNYSLTEYMMYEFLAVSYPKIKALVTEIINHDIDFYTVGKFWSDEEEKMNVPQRAMYKYDVDMSRYSEAELNSIAAVLKIFVPRIYNDLWSSDVDNNRYTSYEGTLSDRAFFRSLINFRDEQNKDSMYMSIYKKFASSDAWPIELNNAKLLDEFSGFVRNKVDYQSKNPVIGFRIAYQILKYIETTDEQLFRPCDLNNDHNLMNRLTYEFIFQLTTAFNRHEIADQQNEESIKLFEQFVKSKATSYEAKLLLFDAFIKQEGDGYIRTDIRVSIIEKLRSPLYFQKLFAGIQRRMFKEYLQPSSNIYRNEANIHYVLYQNWDGLPLDESATLSKLRQVATTGLSSNTSGLMAFWDVYPFEESWQTYDDFLRDGPGSIFFDPSRRGLFLPLKRLLKFTSRNPGMRQRIEQEQKLKDKVNFWRKNQNAYLEREQQFKSIQGKDDATVAYRIQRLA